MIEERMEELAGLYVLEVLTPAERQEFETALGRTPELQALVASLRGTRDALAGTVPPVAPPPHVKQKIMAELDARENKVVPLPVRQTSSSSDFFGFWLPWTMAAASLVVAVNLYMDKGDLRLRVARQSAKIGEMEQLADSLRNTTNSLQQTVLSLNAASKVKDVKIALLGSLLSDSPKAVAVSLWDNEHQSGVFVVQNLKPLPAGRDYQLWVIDPHYVTPVSAGVFQVDSQGNVRINFTADKTIASAEKFAVTMEPKGGVATPTFKNMVLVGG